MSAGESAAADDNLSVVSGATVTAVTGDVSLQAGDNVAIAADSSVAAPDGVITLTAKAADVDGIGAATVRER